MKLHKNHGVLIHNEFDLLLNCLGYRGRVTHLTERRTERHYLHDADAIIYFFCHCNVEENLWTQE